MRVSDERGRLPVERDARIRELEASIAALEEERIEWREVAARQRLQLEALRASVAGMGVENAEASPFADASVEDVESRTGYGSWLLKVCPNNAAYLSPISSHGVDAVRVVIRKAAGQAPWEIQLHKPGPAVMADRVCILHFRARAAGRRRIEFGFARANEPWTDLGLYRRVALTPEWETFREQFTTTADHDHTRILFDIGIDDTAVELASVSLKTIDYPAVQEEAQPSVGTTDGSPAASAPTDWPAGTLNRPIRASHDESLNTISSTVLTAEVLARIQEGAFSRDEESVLLGCELQDALRAVLDSSRNRWSRQRYKEQFRNYEALPVPRPPLSGATILDLGCGALNPYGTLFLFLMLGARRGIAVDLDEVLDVPRAVRSLADLTAMMLIDRKAIIADFPVTRVELLRNIASFDLPRMERGDMEGVDANRLVYARESVSALSLGDGEADFVFSNAVLEHLLNAEAAIAEMARVTRVGGVGVHIVDASDHRSYADAAHHPLEFLTEPSVEPLLHGSNRIRPMEFLPLFERNGFEVLSFEPFRRAEIPEDLSNRLADPWREMLPTTIAVLDCRICVLRRS